MSKPLRPPWRWLGPLFTSRVRDPHENETCKTPRAMVRASSAITAWAKCSAQGLHKRDGLKEGATICECERLAIERESALANAIRNTADSASEVGIVRSRHSAVHRCLDVISSAWSNGAHARLMQDYRRASDRTHHVASKVVKAKYYIVHLLSQTRARRGPTISRHG